MKIYLKNTGIAILLLLVLFSCNGVFEYSPYVTQVKGGLKHIITRNSDWLHKILSNAEGDIKFAMISDTHYDYIELKKFIDHVNSRKDITFVVVGGDIADKGLLKEYEIFEDVMKGLNKPYLTVIGNHDYLAGGGEVYRQMFGAYNYSIEAAGKKIIFFDDVFWESNKRPDFSWLENELKSTGSKKPIIITHIPPWGDQFSKEDELIYANLMKKYKVQLSVHGHVHTSYHGHYYNDETSYVIVPSMLKGTFYEFTLTDNLNIKESKLQ
ncbi:MAG: metallophosphoesterase [Sporocytophaga sp.]|uniref:metallophosphoesterase family protein n=1 Tax=Sporocytophaga sp. TaxID=2231183 RepID=UPI001B1F6BDA|nr:metallophosphoesterase [Sporocytophaga sp.]MBO9702072.1 metallophosphoesterase [Sporocytophaga sp.]